MVFQALNDRIVVEVLWIVSVLVPLRINAGIHKAHYRPKKWVTVTNPGARSHIKCSNGNPTVCKKHHRHILPPLLQEWAQCFEILLDPQRAEARRSIDFKNVLLSFRIDD